MLSPFAIVRSGGVTLVDVTVWVAVTAEVGVTGGTVLVAVRVVVGEDGGGGSGVPRPPCAKAVPSVDKLPASIKGLTSIKSTAAATAAMERPASARRRLP